MFTLHSLLWTGNRLEWNLQRIHRTHHCRRHPRMFAQSTPPRRCGRVGGPPCGNPLLLHIYFHFTFAPIYITSSICIVNSDTPRNFTIVPPSSRPGQGKRPEAASCSSPPPLWNAASGLPSHQQPRIPLNYLRTYFTTFLHAIDAFFSIAFHTLRLGSTFQYLYSKTTLRLPDHRPYSRTYVPGFPP
jgi:hypothetical protein